MNSAIILLLGIVWFIFAYRWYGTFIQKKVLFSDNSKLTPSHSINDGIDYVPTKPSILFGHHFSSIAGAGPIIGPIIAMAYFGWLPALLWVVIGSVFIGAVHDYTSMVISTRNKGISIVEISRNVISSRASSFFALFVWIMLVLVQAVFADLTAKTFVSKPEIVVPSIGLIFVAVLFGVLTRKLGWNVVASTLICIALIGGLIFIGEELPIIWEYDYWLPLIIIYSFLASVLPVWLLLQPRDYLSMYILIIGMLISIVGVFVLHPDINAPAYISFSSAKGSLFPILFITVACGAVSGFHSLVSSGTSAKQINKESDAKIVGYGAMLTEGLLALVVIVMVSSVLIWVPGISTSMGGVPNDFYELFSKNVNLVFGTAIGLTIESIGIPFFLGSAFGILMLNAFILTSLDTSARLNRYVIQETLGTRYGSIFNNRYFASVVGLILAYYLASSGSYNELWSAFGTANQLVATLALFVVSLYLFGMKSPKLYTLIPAFFMLIVTESAFIFQIVNDYIPNGKWVLCIIAVILFMLGLIVAIESIQKIIKNSNDVKLN